MSTCIRLQSSSCLGEKKTPVALRHTFQAFNCVEVLSNLEHNITFKGMMVCKQCMQCSMEFLVNLNLAMNGN